MSPLTLGFLGDKRRKPFAPAHTRVGGRATAYKEVNKQLWETDCKICDRSMSLVAQIDASYDMSVSRILYIFACFHHPEEGEIPCHQQNDGWRVFRASCLRKEDEDCDNQPLGLDSSKSLFDNEETKEPLLSLTETLKNLNLETLASKPKESPIDPSTSADELDWYLVGERGPELPCFTVNVESGDEGCEALLNEMHKYTENLIRPEEADDVEVEEGEIEHDLMAVHAQKVLSLNSDQVLRYQVRGTPLWLCTAPFDDPNKEIINGTKKVPNCPSCKAPRCFEVQVLSTLTSLLLDQYFVLPQMLWSTAVVYVCSEDCNLAKRRGFDLMEDLVVVQSV